MEYWERLAEAENQYGEFDDFSGELAPTDLLPHDTKYAVLRAKRANFSQEVRQLGIIGPGIEALPDQPSV